MSASSVRFIKNGLLVEGLTTVPLVVEPVDDVIFQVVTHLATRRNTNNNHD